jgi:hypothetical protein
MKIYWYHCFRCYVHCHGVWNRLIPCIYRLSWPSHTKWVLQPPKPNFSKLMKIKCVNIVDANTGAYTNIIARIIAKVWRSKYRNCDLQVPPKSDFFEIVWGSILFTKLKAGCWDCWDMLFDALWSGFSALLDLWGPGYISGFGDALICPTGPTTL